MSTKKTTTIKLSFNGRISASKQKAFQEGFNVSYDVCMKLLLMFPNSCNKRVPKTMNEELNEVTSPASPSLKHY